jgi:alpha-galactosidase
MKDKKPIMGWSSWNHFRTNISEEMVKGQADAMIATGLKDAGYSFVNIDDGYFGGRKEDGILFEDLEKFPSGMKSLADYIHSKGLKAGIYSEAGCNTCASYTKLDNFDPKGKGVGLYGFDQKDIKLFFKDWGYDFLKVDWCGGLRQGLSAQKRYSEISAHIKEIAPDAVFNVCRWKFPGEWVKDIADSWRISGDIEPKFGPAIIPGTIMNIVEKNRKLAPFASPGHYNDMDMLQVGRGMSEDEDKAHFSMWCMMSSPLLAGNDLRDMTPRTISILSNPDLIAINQDALGQQAVRVKKQFGIQIWYKALEAGRTAVAVLNTSGRNRKLEIDFSIWFKSETIKECWSGKGFDVKKPGELKIKPHGIAVFLN